MSFPVHMQPSVTLVNKLVQPWQKQMWSLWVLVLFIANCRKGRGACCGSERVGETLLKPEQYQRPPRFIRKFYIIYKTNLQTLKLELQSAGGCTVPLSVTEAVMSATERRQDGARLGSGHELSHTETHHHLEPFRFSFPLFGIWTNLTKVRL